LPCLGDIIKFMKPALEGSIQEQWRISKILKNIPKLKEIRQQLKGAEKENSSWEKWDFLLILLIIEAYELYFDQR